MPWARVARGPGPDEIVSGAWARPRRRARCARRTCAGSRQPAVPASRRASQGDRPERARAFQVRIRATRRPGSRPPACFAEAAGEPSTPSASATLSAPTTIVVPTRRLRPLVRFGRAPRPECRILAGRNTPSGWVAYSPAVQTCGPGRPFRPGTRLPITAPAEQDGLCLHFADEGHGDPVRHSTTSRRGGSCTDGWSVLCEVGRVIVPDYFGFGRSDKPLRIEDYTYDFHVPRSSGW